MLHGHGARGFGSMCLFGFGMYEGINGGLGFTFILIFIHVNAEKVGFRAPSMGLILRYNGPWRALGASYGSQIV